MAPRLLLSSTRGVAARAKLFLTGTQEAFDFLLEQTTPKRKENSFANRSTEAQQNARTQHKISELIKNCDRKALLCHLRGQHRNEERTIPDDIRQLFGISLCGGCTVYYATASIKEHNCRQGIAQCCVRIHPLNQRAPKHLYPQDMTRPSQISEELADRLTAISFDEIFQFPAVTIMEIHHSSVKM